MQFHFHLIVCLRVALWRCYHDGILSPGFCLQYTAVGVHSAPGKMSTAAAAAVSPVGDEIVLKNNCDDKNASDKSIVSIGAPKNNHPAMTMSISNA